MKILLEFILSLCIFIYGIQLLSNGLANSLLKKIKFYLQKYTKKTYQGIILGTFITALVQSSGIITVLIVSLVNANLITFHNSLGLMMGANLGTCLTSWLTSLLAMNNYLFFLNPYNYIPFIILTGLIFHLKKKINTSNILLGFSFFMLGLKMMQNSLNPVLEYTWFQEFIKNLNNPFLSIFIGIIVTSLVQSSSATVAILQTITKSGTITYSNSIPLIMGENIGSCLTTLIGSFNTNKNAKMVAISHLLYNILGTLIFLSLYLIAYYLNLNFLTKKVNSYQIALIHTLFNFLSILVFYPLLNILEKLTKKIVNLKNN